jgi:hypothetical protein
MLMHGAKEPLGVTSGLVLYLDAANARSYPKSGTTWFDRSGNGNNGTLVNGVGYNGSNYGSLSFDGVDDYATIPLSSNFEFGTGQFAVEAWVNCSSLPATKYSRIIGIGEGANGASPLQRTGWSFVIAGTSLSWYRYDGTTQTSISPVIPSLSTGQWFHFVATRDASNTITLSSNGTIISTTPSATTSYNSLNTEPLSIGRWYDGVSPPGYKYLTGNIPVLRIYKGKSLSASEIKQNYDVFKGRYGLT